jgi:hypothetical protein
VRPDSNCEVINRRSSRFHRKKEAFEPKNKLRIQELN